MQNQYVLEQTSTYEIVKDCAGGINLIAKDNTGSLKSVYFQPGDSAANFEDELSHAVEAGDDENHTDILLNIVCGQYL